MGESPWKLRDLRPWSAARPKLTRRVRLGALPDATKLF
jgi:hypothetical protein